MSLIICPWVFIRCVVEFIKALSCLWRTDRSQCTTAIDRVSNATAHNVNKGRTSDGARGVTTILNGITSIVFFTRIILSDT